MITTVFIAAAALLCLKILWNLSIPYVLNARSYAAKDEEERGISLAPVLDAVLLLLAVVAAFPMGRDWPWSPGAVALWGAAIIIASYVHLILAGMVVGWLARVFRRGREEKDLQD